MNNNITLQQATELIRRINEQEDYESYIKGKGNGRIGIIIESKIIKI